MNYLTELIRLRDEGNGWAKETATSILALKGRFESSEITADKFLEGIESLRSGCLLYTSPSPRDYAASRMPSSA